MSELRLRPAVRAVVVDGDRRVLLVRFVFPEGELWATPGGGIDPGETHEQAIRRELAEEVGLGHAELGPAVWVRSHTFRLSERWDGQSETFYLVRATTPAVAPTMSPEVLRAENLIDQRWWTLAELADAPPTVTFAPRRLPALVEALLRDGPPGSPIDVGV